jgi:hypothetical protein
MESPALFETEERVRELAKRRRAGRRSAAARLQSEVAAMDTQGAHGVALAFTVYFDLVNLAEEDYRVSALRQREAENDPDPVDDSIGQAVARLEQSGVSAEQMAALLRELHVEPVLTAHPTEAKRRSILSKVRRISDHIRTWNSPVALPRERAEARAALRTEVATIWLTDRERTVHPSVTDEVRTGLFFIEEVLWEVLPRIYAELDSALARRYPGLTVQHPWLRLGSWIGGDRDGNPNVTTQVTAETLRLHRGLAVERHRHALQVLSRRFSLSAGRVPPSPQLRAWLAGRHPLASRPAPQGGTNAGLAQGRDDPGAHQRGLAAAGRAEDGEEAMACLPRRGRRVQLAEALPELGDERLAAEKAVGVLFLECLQALVRVGADLAGRRGRGLRLGHGLELLDDHDVGIAGEDDVAVGVPADRERPLGRDEGGALPGRIHVVFCLRRRHLSAQAARPTRGSSLCQLAPSQPTAFLTCGLSLATSSAKPLPFLA